MIVLLFRHIFTTLSLMVLILSRANDEKLTLCINYNHHNEFYPSPSPSR